jgi:alcohol dehydrogenase class IV
MNFEFATATRIIFSTGGFAKLAVLAAELGKHTLVVTSPARSAQITQQLVAAGMTHTVYAVRGEPTIAMASAGTELARQQGCDCVIGFGGGSALDAGKAIAALLTNPGDPLDYLEVIGRNQPLRQRSAPYMAIPTTAGTGSEVTRNAVLGSPEHGVKVSLRSPWMLPTVALVDPELTYSMPPGITAATGFDALTQVIEPYVSNQANPLTDAICLEGIRRGARSLRRAYAEPDNAAARADMALTSLFGGLALANAKLGAVHGFAGPFGGMFEAPHGGICAALLPHVVSVNIKVLRQRQPESEHLQRYATVAQLLTSDPQATAEDGVRWLATMARDLQIPGLSSYGLSRAHFSELLAKSAKASSMQGNPLRLSEEEMAEILELAL